MHPAKFAGGRNDAVPKLRPIGTFPFALADDGHRLALGHLNLPAVLAGAAQMRADPRDRSVFHDRTVVTGRVHLNRVGDHPTKAVVGRTNTEPTVFGFGVNFQRLSVTQLVGSVIVARRAATGVRTFLGDENDVRFRRQIFLGAALTETTRHEYRQQTGIERTSQRIHRARLPSVVGRFCSHLFVATGQNVASKKDAWFSSPEKAIRVDSQLLRFDTR